MSNRSQVTGLRHAKGGLDNDCPRCYVRNKGSADFSSDEDSFEINTEVSDLYAIKDDLETKGYKIASAEEDKILQSYMTLEDPEDIKNMNALIEHLEDSGDVQEIYHNWGNCD